MTYGDFEMLRAVAVRSQPSVEPTMPFRARLVFYLHALTAAYCICCALVDLSGHAARWLAPSFPVACLLLGTALIFPICSVLATRNRGTKHGTALVAHFAMSTGQFLAALPLLVS